MASDPEFLADMTAAELALGLLDGDERAAALRRMLSDPDFAREVTAWRDRLAGLFDDYPEIAAPDAIARRLAEPETVPARRRGWPVLAVVAGLAAMLALVFVMRPGPPTPPVVVPHRLMVASLMLSDKSSSIPAVVDATTGTVRIASADIAPAGKSAQLWLIGGNGIPQSMGLLATNGPSRVMVQPPQRAALAAGVTLAVSIEPSGGSPTGKPTGPVVASGKLSVT